MTVVVNRPKRTVTLTMTPPEHDLFYDYTVRENGTRLFEHLVSNFLQQQQSEVEQRDRKMLATFLDIAPKDNLAVMRMMVNDLKAQEADAKG